MQHFLLGTHLVSLHIEFNPERIDEILLSFDLAIIFRLEFDDVFVHLVLVSLLFSYSLFFDLFQLLLQVLGFKFELNHFLLLLLLQQVCLKVNFACLFGRILPLLLRKGSVESFSLFPFLSLELLLLFQGLNLTFEGLVLFLNKLQRN